MNDEFQKNVAAAFAAAQSTVLNDLGALSGINPAYAQAYPALLGGFMAAKAAGGGQATPLDTYAMGVIGGLAALVTTDPRQAAACFEDIAAWAGGGAAHCRTALEAEKRAQGGPGTDPAAQEASTVVQAAGGAPEPAWLVEGRERDAAMEAQQDAEAKAAAFRQAGMASPALGSGVPQSGATAVMPQAVPQDPRERAAGAYDASADEAANPKI